MSRTTWAKLLLLIAVIAAVDAPRAGARDSAPKIRRESMLVLPLELVAGEPATLAILLPDGHIAAGVKLVLSDGEMLTTDESGRAHFLGPPDVGILIARIPGTETSAALDVVERIGSAQLEIATVPGVAALNDRFTITGDGFQGDADRNRIELGGKSALVLAASSKELVILGSPQTAPGKTELAVKIGSQEVSTDITLVNVSSDVIPDAVSPGTSGKFVLHVRGTTQPVDLDVRNMSSKSVRFKHGEREYVQTQGGIDNSATLEIKATHAGEFSYAVRLKSQPGTANVEVASDFLQAIERLADDGEKSRIKKILKQLRPRNTDIRAARQEFAKIPTATSGSDLQALMRAADEALNGN